jgi:hypothetical protein
MIEAILSCDCDSECTNPNSHLRLLTRKGGRDHSAIDRRPLPRITFGGTSSGRALCPRAEGSAGSDGCKPTGYRASDSGTVSGTAHWVIGGVWRLDVGSAH